MTFWSEVHEQPAVLDRLLGAEGWRAAREATSAFRRPDVRFAMIAARGTSDNAARYAQYLWGGRNRLTVALATPSLFTTYASPPSLDGAVVIGISQSGRSPDLVAVLEEARAQRRPTVAITNDPGSPLASAADVLLELRAGPERAVAATKTYTAELAATAMLSAALADDDSMSSELVLVPGQVSEVLAASGLRELAGEFAAADRGVVLGRGYHLSTAFEWALKLQELCAVGAQPFSTVDFEHGPIAMMDEGVPLYAVVPSGPLGPEIVALLERLDDERSARTLAIASPQVDVHRADRLPLPAEVEEWSSPIVAAVLAHLFTGHLCEARGLDPDAPRGLAKVTRTW